jgi:hypothetical protein
MLTTDPHHMEHNPNKLSPRSLREGLMEEGSRCGSSMLLPPRRFKILKVGPKIHQLIFHVAAASEVHDFLATKTRARGFYLSSIAS